MIWVAPWRLAIALAIVVALAVATLLAVTTAPITPGPEPVTSVAVKTTAVPDT